MTLSNDLFPAKRDLPREYQFTPVHGRILIDGEILDSGFDTKEVRSPCQSRGDADSLEAPVLGSTPQVTVDGLIEALDAATAAWARGAGRWPTSHMSARTEAVSAFRDEMLKRRERICKLLMWEIAKTWKDTLAEFDRTIQYIDDTIESVKQLDRDSSRIQFNGGIMAQIRRAPLGVTLCMGPFNYPLNETFTTLIPALIMGNPVVVKLPRFGQLFWDLLLEPFRDCFPKGVVNIMNGTGRKIVEPAVQTGKVDVLAFIGSSRVAVKIKQAHPRPHRLRSILSLDAKNPGIVLPDADLDHAVSESILGSLSFNGQRCTALKIFFAHSKIYDSFVEKLSAGVDKLSIGMPWVEGVKITPLVEENKPAQLKDYVDEAVSLGATVANAKGGQTLGTFYYPAVLADVSLKSKIAQEEQFGPVVPVVRYTDAEELIDFLVQSPFGMQASLFGRDPRAIGPMIDQLSNQVCRINLNSQCQRGPDVFPFTGRKSSAEGTLSVYDALRSFSIRSMVATRQDEAGKRAFRDILEGDHSQFLSSKILL